jgi:hypothetical protein
MWTAHHDEGPKINQSTGRNPMKNRKGAGVGLALLLIAQLANATVIYDYVGKPFTTIVDHEIPAGTYTTSMFVTASLTFANPLAANTPYVLFNFLTPLAYTISDGRQTFDGSKITDELIVVLSTDAGGNISRWLVDAENTFTGWKPGDKSFLISTVNVDNPNDHHEADQGFQQYCMYYVGDFCGLDTYDQGYNQSYDPKQPAVGTWTMRTVGDSVSATVPEPSTVPMLSLGLIGLAWFRRTLHGPFPTTSTF